MLQTTELAGSQQPLHHDKMTIPGGEGMFQACPTERSPRGSPVTHYLSQMALELLRIPQEELVDVAGEKDAEAALLSLINGG